jgi:hypothetical protein
LIYKIKEKGEIEEKKMELQGLDRKAKERFFVNDAADWQPAADAEGDKAKLREVLRREAVPQLEAHIQRVLTLVETKWPPSTRIIEYVYNTTRSIFFTSLF